jgi:homoserine O-acetyltransferase
MAQVYEVLARELKIKKIHLLIGASIGGQQALEFSYSLKTKLKKLVLIATNARHSAFGIAFNESQRLALASDKTFFTKNIEGGKKGLVAARSIAMLSYRTYEGYEKTQKESSNENSTDFKASSYQSYQGNKLADRFNAFSYFYLTKAMDSHNIGRKRSSIESALSKIKAKTFVIGIRSDILFPLSEQQYLARNIPDAKLFTINSLYGHDGFLIEAKKINKILRKIIIK